jgi:hypothetical protein
MPLLGVNTEPLNATSNVGWRFDEHCGHPRRPRSVYVLFTIVEE